MMQRMQKKKEQASMEFLPLQTRISNDQGKEFRYFSPRSFLGGAWVGCWRLELWTRDGSGNQEPRFKGVEPLSMH